MQQLDSSKGRLVIKIEIENRHAEASICICQEFNKRWILRRLRHYKKNKPSLHRWRLRRRRQVRGLEGPVSCQSHPAHLKEEDNVRNIVLPV